MFHIRNILIALMMTMLSGCAGMLSMPISFQEGSAGFDLLAIRQPKGPTCALTCLYSVAEYWGAEKSITRIQEELGKMPKGGYTLRQLRDWARRNGFAAFVVKADISDLRKHTEKGRPIIVTFKASKKGNHSVVVLEVLGDGDLVVMDPKKGRDVIMPLSAFLPRWKILGNPILIIAKAESLPGDDVVDQME